MRRMVVWLAATIAHFALTFVWVRAAGPRPGDHDDLVFHSAVIGLGSLQAVLHTVAFSIGLSLGRGLTALAAAHLAVAAAFAFRARLGRRTPDLAGAGSPPMGRAALVLAAAGAVVVTAIGAQWAVAASSSLRVTGADAAHYHVPYAVNIALGANPFGPPATAHLYPMGTSVLAAWFILPFQDPLLVDLANLLPFLLGWFAALRIVRDTTGRSGLAWGPWCALALFSAPLFRHSLLMSADLFYATAFLAANALLLRFAVRLRVDGLEAVALGFAVGMLVSTKVTGAVSAVALAGVYSAVILTRTLARRRGLERSGVSIPVLCAATAAVFASGGVWLVRNWWNFGSPIAPSGLYLFGFEIFRGEKYGDTKYYLSVLGDVRGVTNYHLASRLWYWIGVWLGAWFPVSGLLAAVPVIQACLGWFHSRQADASLRARLIFAAASAALVAVHLAMLSGAPWSSLEWTDGYSLRYALPCAALIWVVAYVSGAAVLTGVPRLETAAAFFVAAASVAWYVGHQGVPEGPADEALARLTLAGTALGIALVSIGCVVARLRRRAWSAVAAAILIAAVTAAYGPRAERTDARLVRAAEAVLDRHVACSTCDGMGLTDHRAVYLELLGYERLRGVQCAGRRIYTTSRWDVPLELQSPRFENRVFDVRGASIAPFTPERRPQAGAACEYVIATRAALDTTNGVALVNRLRAQGRLTQAAETGRFVLFAVR
jgi:hypothetical protein